MYALLRCACMKQYAQRRRVTRAQASMLFGLHIALSQVNEHSDVAFHHPQWLTPGLVKDYFGATGLCLNDPDAKEWLQQQVVAVIDSNDVDYIVTDSEDFLKMCSQLPDFNYASAVFGLDALVAQVRSLGQGLRRQT